MNLHKFYTKLFTNFLFFYFFFHLIKCEIDPNKTLIWGPGLAPDEIVMPARYFFIQPVNENGYLNKSLSKDFQISISGINKNKISCRIWTNILNRKTGSYIVRYKIYELCTKLKIEIKYDNTHIGNSPYVINNNVYSDGCYCPIPKVDEFLSTWECSKVPDRINHDLQFFQSINWNILRPKIIEEYNQPLSKSFCNYVIKNNKVYRKCYGKYVGFNMFMDNLLLSLSRKVVLPDSEFFVNLGDWPLVYSNENKTNPIFSWCGSTDSFDIVMPTYDLTESTLENMGRVTLDILSVQGNAKQPWQNRIPRAFWRGRDSSKERLELIKIAKANPNLINASITNFFFFTNEENTCCGPKAEHISFFKFFDYKYQLNLDGTVAAYRFPYLLAGGSLTFKQESKYFEHFYDYLKPYIHYIPIKRDLRDLIEKLHWAIDNEEEAEKIAKNGQLFVNNNLLPQHIFCYYIHLINEFSKKIVSPINIDGLDLVSDNENSRNCQCQRIIKDEL